MVYVLFQVILKEGLEKEYLDIASSLKEELEKIKGFIKVERFISVNDNNKLLSLSLFETEESINNWRNNKLHRLAQLNGRLNIFKSYEITILKDIRNYTNINREEAPKDSNIYFNEKEDK